MPGLGCASLEELREHIGDCHRCQLGWTRTQVVFGAGSPNARVMFIGEGPGKNEDLKGEPFVGAAGQLLNDLLAHAHLAREDVYIANVVKCRPPGNRDPEPEEIEACTPFLREQIRIIRPDVLVTMGNFATKFVLSTQVGITRLHGRVHHAGRFTVLPVYHPAAAIYDRSKHDDLFADFARLALVLAETPAGAGAAPGSEPLAGPAGTCEPGTPESEGRATELAPGLPPETGASESAAGGGDASRGAPADEQPRLF